MRAHCDDSDSGYTLNEPHSLNIFRKSEGCGQAGVRCVTCTPSMTTSSRTVLRSGLLALASFVLVAVGLPGTAASAVAAPIYDYENRGSSPLRVGTAGGVDLYLYGARNLLTGATATFTPYDVGLAASTVTEVPVTVFDSDTAVVTAPAMPAGPVKITLFNPGSAASSTFMTVSYGDTVVELSFSCAETSISLNANVGDFVRLVPSGACGDVYVPYPVQAPSYTRGIWSVGALGNLSSPPEGFLVAEHPLSTVGYFTNPAYWPTTQSGLAQSEFGSWHPVVGSDWAGETTTWVGGYNRFTDNPTGLVLQVMPSTQVGDEVAFLYQLVPSSQLPEQEPTPSVQIPIVYAGGRIEPVVPPAPAPAPSAEPIVVPTVAPVVIPTTAPTAAPVELPAGTGGALINGVSTPVTVAAAAGGNAVVVSAGGVTVEVGGTAPDGRPLPLAPDGSLIVAQSGGVSMGGAGFSPNSTVSLFLYSTPTKLGELPVSATGSYSGSALIPAGIEAGSHTIQAVGYTPSGETLALSVGVTVKSVAAIRGAKPVMRVSAGTKTAGAKFVATASGVQSRCTVRFWTKGTTQTVKAGVAGKATAVLKAPSSAGTWAVTATVSGDGCEPKATKSMIRVVPNVSRS